MRVDITGRHLDITPGLRQLIDKSLAKVERLLNDRAVSATVVLTKERYRHKTEIVVHAKGDHILSGVGEGNTWPLSIRKAAAKIDHQSQKLKSKWTEGKLQRVIPVPMQFVTNFAALPTGQIVVVGAFQNDQPPMPGLVTTLSH